MSYDQLVLRNQGYVPVDLQERIRATRVLIAGCGVGSSIAEACVRLGFEQFILADGDRVEVHNLNRQAFMRADVGNLKVAALAARLRTINPDARIEEFGQWLATGNIGHLVSRADLIFDTIDFLDLTAITAVHDEGQRQKKPIISALSAGWGAATLFFPGDHSGEGSLFRKLFGLPAHGPVSNQSYVEHFGIFLQRLAPHLDNSILQAMAKALNVMKDGTPCPAPHVSAGSYCVASLVTTIAARVVAGAPVLVAPRMALVNLIETCVIGGIDLTPTSTPDPMKKAS
jgi:molybdopterin-synthase adenylyltransferase